MKIYVRILSIILVLFLGGITHAKDVEVNLAAEHGADLAKAPFAIRYKFAKTTGLEWKSSSYEDRKAFLEDWYTKRANEKKILDAQMKEEEKERKRITREEKVQEQIEKKRLKMKLDRQKKEARDEQILKKEAAQRLKEEQRKVEQLRSNDRKSF